MKSVLPKVKITAIVFVTSLILLKSEKALSQVSMGFENLSTTQSETSVNSQYYDLGNEFAFHNLDNYTNGGNNIPVSSPSSGTILGFQSSFTPTRTGGSNVGLTDGDTFGYATGAAADQVGQSPIEGSAVFFAEDTDGLATITFDPVNLIGAVSPMFSMNYIVDGSFEFSDGANDRLYIRLDISGCANATTISLYDSDGGGTGGGGGADMDASSTDKLWVPLSQNLSAYIGCNAQLVVEVDLNSSTEEIAIDNISFTSGTTVLPIELTSFEANPNEENISLNWATATEINNSGFTVERSLDGKQFNKLDWVDGSGNSLAEVQYEFIDETVIPNEFYYYRLRQEDYDGTFEYSQIVFSSLSIQKSDEIGEFYPNPSLGGKSNIAINVLQESDYKFNIISMQGQLLSTVNHKLSSGLNQVGINLNNFPRGNYLIQITGNNLTESRRIIR